MMSVIVVVCSLYVFLSMRLFVLCVTVLRTCLLNVCAICVGEVVPTKLPAILYNCIRDTVK